MSESETVSEREERQDHALNELEKRIKILESKMDELYYK